MRSPSYEAGVRAGCSCRPRIVPNGALRRPAAPGRIRPRALMGGLLGLAMAASLLASSALAGGRSARATIEQLDAAYVEVMKNAAALGYSGRFAKLEPVLSSTFDFAAMARLSVGGRWKDLTLPQQQTLARTFGRLSIATYAGRFTSYSGERFEITGEEPSIQGTVLVRTRVLIPEHETVLLDYRLRPGPDGWRVIDVFMNGTVSELALRRSEYSAVLDRAGFDGLIGALDQKIEAFATKPAPPEGS